MWVSGLFRTTTDFNVHEMMALYRRVRGIRMGMEVQIHITSPGSVSRIQASSTSSSTKASISSKRSHIPSLRSSCSAYSRIGKDWYRCGIGLANAWSFFFFIFMSSSVGMYPKLYLDPLTRTKIGSIIPCESLPIRNPVQNHSAASQWLSSCTWHAWGSVGPSLDRWHWPAPPCKSLYLTISHQ